MQTRPSIAAVGLIALVALAGCAGLVDSGEGTGTSTATSTPTATPTSTPTVPADANASNTVPYEDLSEEAKTAFEAARTEGARFIEATEYVDGDPFDPDGFDEYAAHRYLERNGTYYEIRISMGELYATYHIRASASNVSVENATAVEDLPENVSSEVRWAIENGSYGTPLGQWQSLPAPLDDVEYVHVDGDVDSLSFLVGDNWVQRVYLDRVD